MSKKYGRVVFISSEFVGEWKRDAEKKKCILRSFLSEYGREAGKVICKVLMTLVKK